MGVNVIVELPDGRRALHARDCQLGCNLREFVEDHIPLSDDYFLVHQGKLISPDEVVSDDDAFMVVRCVPRLLGGKGGFGSMLRTIGNQIEKTTNKDACRDLNGRRIRDVKADKAVEEWQKGEQDRQEAKEEARKQRRDRMLAEPKSSFDSSTYLAQIKDTAEQTEESIRIGMAAQQSRGASAAAASSSFAVSAVKRSSASSNGTASKRKRATLRALDRFTGVDSGSSDESDEDVESSPPSSDASTDKCSAPSDSPTDTPAATITRAVVAASS